MENDVYEMQRQEVERVFETFVRIGLLKRIDHIPSEEEKSNADRKIEDFFDVGEENGFDFTNEISSENILDFYLSITPQERIALGCKPEIED
jgi:hypothetical protein